jgi:hypothetical protein
MRKREIMTKQFELNMEQVDTIVTDELKEAIELNWQGDHELVESAFKLLAYYLPAEDYQQYVDQLKLDPPNNEPYENSN